MLNETITNDESNNNFSQQILPWLNLAITSASIIFMGVYIVKKSYFKDFQKTKIKHISKIDKFVSVLEIECENFEEFGKIMNLEKNGDSSSFKTSMNKIGSQIPILDKFLGKDSENNNQDLSDSPIIINEKADYSLKDSINEIPKAFFDNNNSGDQIIANSRNSLIKVISDTHYRCWEKTAELYCKYSYPLSSNNIIKEVNLVAEESKSIEI